jgi:hypothetical protein
MAHHTGNLGTGERALSALFGAALSILAMRRGGGLTRAASAVAGLSLLSRAAAGHCAMKASLTGQSTLRQGLADQWERMRSMFAGDDEAGRAAHAEARSAAISRSRAVDESVIESFPASDPPASRLPDEPPSNADAKWAAAREAERKGR